MRRSFASTARLALWLALAVAATARAVPAGAQPASTPARQPSTVQYTDHAMGTNVTVWLWTADDRGAAQAAEAVFAEMKRLDKEMTTWDPKSEVSQINAAAGGKPVTVSDETYAVIDRAIDVSRRSKGLFDITIGAFKGVWKFDDDMDGTLPDPAAVKEVVLDARQHTVFLRRKAMSITLGGIAKGYAVDKCVAILKARGFHDFMMQAGGDMYVAGRKGSEQWRIGVRDPRGPTNTMFAVAPVEDHSFSTSGDYERGFVKDGVRYHHILDTRNGQPAHASHSVTVRAKDAFTADAWSKVMFIMGPAESLELIKREKLTDFEVVWVDDKNQVDVTPGLKSTLWQQRPPTPGP
ncbi:MAG: FAD:protein FMN transferase [Deltaproteobacteria bacterium]|nr:MAG: FAD:protein FMN transferase [Deltaproteobacteria bacterium]